MLYIIRHGKTDWNEKRKLQGRTDIPLNEEGRQMARKAQAAARSLTFDVCYCSPLLRARETAEILLEETGVPIVFDKRLLEMCFGAFEGVENSFDDPSLAINVLFQKSEEYVSCEGSESFEELFARTGAFLREVVYPDLEQGKNVLIVGHGAMNSSIVCQIRRMPLAKFWDAGIPNCEFIQLL